jgi:hypothetical protein
LPEKIHIQGSPELRFAAGLDFSEEFREMMRDAFSENDQENVVIQDCINAPDWMTFLIRVGLVAYQEGFEIGEIEGFDDSGPTFPLQEDKELINTEITLHFFDFRELLGDFKFGKDGIKSSFFITVPEAIEDKIKIELSFVDGETVDIPLIIPNNPSNIDLKASEYGGTDIPGGGVEFDDISDYLNGDENRMIQLKVSLISGEEYPVSLLKDLLEDNKLDINVEWVIWLPLFFEMEDGAELILPGFDDLGDFLFSLTTDSDGMIKSLNLEIGLDSNPFKDGKFIVRNIEDDTDVFVVNMDADEIAFDVRPEDIDYINEIKKNGTDFITDFIIKFEEGAKFGIPKTLKIMSIAVGVGIDHTISFGGGS